jgi:hypothetical protein
MLRWLSVLGFLIAAVLGAAWLGLAQAETRQEAALCKQSRDAYYATGHPCACPYDFYRNGITRCGRVSAYCRPGGAEPCCYPGDLNPATRALNKRQHC